MLKQVLAKTGDSDSEEKIRALISVAARGLFVLQNAGIVRVANGIQLNSNDIEIALNVAVDSMSEVLMEKAAIIDG